MSSRLIEECFEIEELGGEYYTWIKIPAGTSLLVVDPCMIEMRDLRVDSSPGSDKTVIVRIRRPGWGKGNISNYIQLIKLEKETLLCPMIIKKN